MLGGGNHHSHPATLHARGSLDLNRFAELGKNGLKDLCCEVPVEPFTSAKEHGELYPVSFSKERPCALELDLAIVGIRLWPHADALQGYGMSAAARFLPLLAVVFELAVVHDPANRRPFRRPDLDKIETRLPRLRDGLSGRDNTELRLILVD